MPGGSHMDPTVQFILQLGVLIVLTLSLHVPAPHETFARLVIAEEMLTLRSMLHMAQEGSQLDAMEHDLIARLFAGDQKDEPS